MEVGRRQFLLIVVSALTGCGTETILGPSTTTRNSPITTSASSESSATSIPPITNLTLAESTLPATPRPVEELVVIERAGWEAAQPREGMIEHEISHLTVHHTAVTLTDNRLAPSRLRAHQRFHQIDRSWPDLAYHFAIDQQGNIYEGRAPQFRGDTATVYDPTGHFLVVLEGNFDHQLLPDEQRAGLVNLLAWAGVEYEVDPLEVHGHRDYAETSCPGEAVYALISSGELTDEVRSRIGESAITLNYLRGEEASERVTDIEG